MLTELKYMFIEFILKNKILKFGDYILKSKKQSQYYIDFGLVNNGKLLEELGFYYAQFIIDNKINFDILVGPPI